jgi:D-alanine transaminase
MTDDRISFVNGKFVPHEKAFVHIEDRGFQFADGVYEVILLYKNKIIDFENHIARLFASLAMIKIDNFTLSIAEIKEIVLSLFLQNNLETGYVYLQVTRGVAARTQHLPQNNLPTFIATVSPLTSNIGEEKLKSLKVMTDIDMRWNYCNVKAIGLLASSLAKQKAQDLGFDDVVLVRDGFITEGSFSNLFIVDDNGAIITRDADNYILSGITRERLIKLAVANNFTLIERKFTVDELISAKEAFLTSSTLGIRPIIAVDNKQIGEGIIGSTALQLSKLYVKFLLT